MTASLHRTKLENVCTRITVGHVGPMASEYVDQGIPFLRSQNITPFRVNLDDVKFVRPEFHARLKKSALRPGDVAVIRTGYPGVAAVVPSTLGEANCADLVVVTPSATDLDPYYLAAIFNSTWGKAAVAGNLVGVAQQHFNIGAARNMEVVLPPLRVQRRVAGIVSAYDELIENCRRRIRVLDEMARALYREWFVLFRYPGHERTPLVDTELGRIPAGWEIASLGEICARVTDGAHASPKSVPQGVPMASSKDMSDWGLNLATARQISEHDFDQLVRNGCQPAVGDVLVTKDGANYLKRIFVLRDELDVVLLSSIAILRCNGRIRPSLLAATLKSPENLNRLKNYVTGAAIPRIVLKDFKAFRLVLPSSEVQLAWSRVGEPLQESCWMLSAQIANLTKTRELLLPRLLAGQLRLADAA